MTVILGGVHTIDGLLPGGLPDDGVEQPIALRYMRDIPRVVLNLLEVQNSLVF